MSGFGRVDKMHSSKDERIVSFQSRLPISLQKAMNGFIEKHPNWDQYRIIKAALAGFLVQNNVNSRSITRLYIDNMFGANSVISK
ncbi:hypothetical protein EV11_1810 [Prochlorococcus sp. SS52]|nr:MULTISPECIES: DUF2811 domain-containing protein [Prochlorococcus]KGG20461.1 hypothetical protein EV08_1046 [Prochlorococcus marinus str. SS2]KGG24129.1 hypothetical protein EV09_0735 [Prochlorococcus marinus str. SS35]KGG31613.1 hypothetical protein EV10_1707 [Prochlorococcus marinus str. SS51]KGG34680.1 hypothetical protein EV11_1810 [Prochlorococcus sp. SS52]